MKEGHYLFTLIIAITIIHACSKNSITGRNQLALLPETELQAMASQEYQQFLSENRIVSSAQNRDAEMVRRVGKRLTNSIIQYYAKENLTDQLSGYRWEYNLVESNEVNAWCMPGGKIVVYTGFLPVTQNEAGLAIVMAHEIAHALAGHANERLSQEMLAQGIGVTGNLLTMKNEKVNNIFQSVYAPASQLGVLLPNSRKQELEADRYGLIFSAMAGYNPQESIPFWKRMESMPAGNKPPEFLSTHPSGATRIKQLEKYMKEALSYYKPM